MTTTSPRFALVACASLSALSLPALASAQTAAGSPTSEAGPHDAAHGPESGASGDIVVVGHPPTDFGLLAATTNIAGDTLVAEARGQIGEILNSLPGVSSTSFSPGASRPILRGFGGDRVSVLTDGIGSLDASNVSVDHAVVFDALTVDHIDVFHGPSILLFGGNAIGGAVNAIDKRIPRRVPDAITATAIASYGTAADERAASGAVDVPLGDRFVAHIDGAWRKSEDLRVGGAVYSPQLRADMLGYAAQLRAGGDSLGASEVEAEAGRSGRVPNSAARTTSLGAGLAFIDAGGSLGLSYQRFDTVYGVPSRPATSDEQEAEGGVSIDLVQDRFDLRGELVLGGLFDRLQVRGAYADYRHAENEGDAVGTVFEGNGIEARADLVQADRGGWRGRSGVQYLWRSLTVTGAEAIVPDYEIERVGVFTLQSLDLGGGFKIDGSGRYDSSRLRSLGAGYTRSFDLWSGAAGASWQADGGLGIGANFVHGERAPSPEELLSDGVHVATQSYEVGNGALGVERSNGVEAYVRYQSPALDISLTGYRTQFANYIAPLATGAVEEGQPVYEYTGVDAIFTGFEAQASADVLAWSGGRLKLDAAADYTRARIKSLGPVPHIPAMRVRGGSEVVLGHLRLRGELEWNAAQNRVGAYENRTRSFTLVNLGADWHPMGEDGPITLMLAADNLLDVVGRRSASFTRDFVPIAGRDVRVTVKFAY